MPEISIIIPTRNRGSLLASRALPSALAQEGVDQEVVVVDDGSSDDTVARLAAWDDARIRVVPVDGPHGVSIARNAGIAAARGEWLAFLDDDDVWAPTKLRTQLEVGRNENADFVYAGALAVDAQGTVIHELYLPPADELAAKLDQACVVPAGCSNVIARTESVRRVHGFDERLANLADWDLWIRLVPIARPAACAEVLVAYVLHDGNLHVVEDPGDELDYLVRKHANADVPRRIAVDRIGYARWVASQRSRTGRHAEAARVYLRSGLAHRSPGNIVRAADALLGKRLSALARRGRPDPPRPTAPDWLAVLQP
jgi:glycosyltransferase involved in cell wall biosynthesis